MQLPAALRPWAEELAHLPLEMAEALAPLVRRLASAIGPLRSGAPAAADEVDGLSGLARRGSLERLLLSDWLLADEIPDEFLRRAAEGELLFLQLDRRQPRAGRRSIALFDCGPAQLGTPRIAHLALLVVLARRARAAGAEFVWGALQDRQCSARALDSEQAVRELLAARSAACARAEDLARWTRALEPALPGEDTWLIGSSASLRERARASVVEIEDALDAELASLEVRVRTRDGAAPALRLELPPPEVCVRLIRDPYTPLRRGVDARLEGIDASRRMYFSENSAFLVCAVQNGIAALAIPHSTRDQGLRSRPRRILAENIPLAAHAGRTRLAALTTDGTRIFFRGTWPFNDPRGPLLPPDLAADPGAPVLPCWIDRAQATFRDARGTVWELSTPSARLVLRHVAALARLNGEFYWLLRAGPDLHWCHAPHVPSTHTVPMHRFRSAGPGAFLCGGRCGPLAAVQTTDGLWDLRTTKRGEIVNLPSGMLPGGIVVRDVWPCLAAVADGREVVLAGQGKLLSLYRAPATILDVACAPNGARIALLTTDGAIRVLRAADGVEILHVGLEDQA